MIEIEQLKNDGYLISDIEYKTQTTDKYFEIEYKQTSNSIIITADKKHFYPIP